jgi:molybdate transport system permease protein
VPLAWPGLVAGAILAFARALGEFGATVMVAGNVEGKTLTAPVAIYFAAEEGDLQRAGVYALLLAILNLCFMALVSAISNRRHSSR